MRDCAECTELLLEYLYGLLDEPAAQELREHLASCPACQAALEQAKAQQELLTRAARKYRDVPLFEAPAGDVLPMPAVATYSPETNARREPASAPPPRARRRWLRWAAVGAAAALLIAVGTIYAGYERELHNRQKLLADARNSVETIDTKLVSLVGEEKKQKQQMLHFAEKLQGQFLHVGFMGPATYQPQAASSYRISTQTPTGPAATAKVAVKLLSEANQVVFNETYPSTGELRFVLPAKLALQPGTMARLTMEITNGQATETLEQPLTVLHSNYASHLALNNETFKPGDTLYFRTATLDSNALTPPDRSLQLNNTIYRVVGQELEAVKQFQSKTGPGGIAGGDFPVTYELPPGPYLFIAGEGEVSKDNSAIPKVQGESRQLYVQPANPLQQIVTATPGKSKPGSSVLAAEFFPEGGDLTASTENRVYFRLHHIGFWPQGIEAVVEDGKQQEIAKIALESADTSIVRNQWLGSFRFTPRPEERYSFRLTAGGKVLGRFPLPTVIQPGVTLSVPEGVVEAGQPVRVQVRSPQGQQLLVLVSGRGHIGDQKIVEAGEQSSNVTLEPVPGCDGVLRVTVYEKSGEEWRPAAERLIYRKPAQSLQLSATYENIPGKGYQPGQKVELRIESRNEAKALTPAWMHAVVIDENVLKPSDNREPGLPAFFLLTNQLRSSQDLENADLLLTEAPAAARSLDLFLGTQGWRRFIPQSTAAPARLVASKDAKNDKQVAAATLFFGGTQLANVQRDFVTAVREKQDAWWNDLQHQRGNLQSEREVAESAARTAAANLGDYQTRPMTWLRTAAGFTLAGLLILGALLLIAGLFVALRRRSSPRPWLASSFAVLLLGLVLFSAAGLLRPTDDAVTVSHLLGWLTPSKLPAMAHGENDKPNALPKKLNDAGKEERFVAQVYAKVAEESAADKNTAERLNPIVRGTTPPFGPTASGATTAKSPLPDVFAKGDAKAKDTGGLGGGGAGGGAGFGGAGKAGGKKAAAGAGKLDTETNKQQQSQPMQVPVSPFDQTQNATDMKNMIQNVLPVAPRDYANLKEQGTTQQQGTILWQPQLEAKDGSARVEFNVLAKPTTYRVVIYGHTADGRLGVYHGTLTVGGNAAKR